MQKNLNDIIPPSRRRAMASAEDASVAQTPSSSPLPERERPSYNRPRAPRPRRSFPVAAIAIAVGVIALSAAALVFFSGAEVAITQTENRTTVSGDFIATGSTGELPFEVITVEKTAMAVAQSEGTETVNQSAQGSITIENRQDAPQQLIKNTRFETPEGRIFRIRDSITVPPAVNGNPGRVDATVYADATGEAYNIGATTFTLPGLTGTTLFSLVSARSTEPMKGGFSGPRPTVSQATRDSKTAELRTTLAADIEKELAAGVPQGYVLVPGSHRVTYEAQPDMPAAGNAVEITEKAIATAVVFPSEALAKAIAYQVVGIYSGQTVTLTDTAGLTLTPVGDLPAPGATELAFSLTGTTTILWQVDTDKIASAVAGKSRSGAETALAGFPEVERAALVLRPFWKMSFPEDPTKITVTVNRASAAQ